MARAWQSSHNDWSQCRSQRTETFSGVCSAAGWSTVPQEHWCLQGCGTSASYDCEPGYNGRWIVSKHGALFIKCMLWLQNEKWSPVCYRCRSTVWDDQGWCLDLHNTADIPNQPQLDRCCTVLKLKRQTNAKQKLWSAFIKKSVFNLKQNKTKMLLKQMVALNHSYCHPPCLWCPSWGLARWRQTFWSPSQTWAWAVRGKREPGGVVMSHHHQMSVSNWLK